MEWLIQALLHNNTLFAAGLTLVLSIFGAKKVVGKRINFIFAFTKETLDVVLVLSKALKPDADGKIRIDNKELEEIQKELADMRKSFGKVVAL